MVNTWENEKKKLVNYQNEKRSFVAPPLVVPDQKRLMPTWGEGGTLKAFE